MSKKNKAYVMLCEHCYPFFAIFWWTSHGSQRITQITGSDSRLTAIFYPRNLWCHLLCLTGSILLRFPTHNTCWWSWCQPNRRRQGGNLWSRLESGYRHTSSREGVAYWSTKQCDYIPIGDCWHHRGKGVPMSESICLSICGLLQSIRQRKQSEECTAVFTYLNM